MNSRLLLIPLLLISCSKKPEFKLPTPRVEVGSVKIETIPLGLNAVGHARAYRSAEIKAQVEGRLLHVHYQEGAPVNKGDLLLTIDPDPYVADLEQALALRAENFAKLKYAAETVVRYRGLLKDDYVSQLEFDGFVKNLAEYEALVMQNDAAIRSAQINLDYCYIKSPFAGIAGKKLIDEGNLITNDGSTMVVINQINPIYIDFSLPETDFKIIMKFKKGDKPLDVDVFIPDENQTFTARLILVDNTIDPNTGMVPLRAQVENPQYKFWPGQYVEANLILTEQDNALLVPTRAIMTGSKGQFVYVIDDDNTAQYVPIKAFNVYKNMTHIKADLPKNAKVVIKGQINLRPGIKVNIVPPKESK